MLPSHENLYISLLAINLLYETHLVALIEKKCKVKHRNNNTARALGNFERYAIYNNWHHLKEQNSRKIAH